MGLAVLHNSRPCLPPPTSRLCSFYSPSYRCPRLRDCHPGPEHPPQHERTEGRRDVSSSPLSPSGSHNVTKMSLYPSDFSLCHSQINVLRVLKPPMTGNGRRFQRGLYAEQRTDRIPFTTQHDSATLGSRIRPMPDIDLVLQLCSGIYQSARG